MKALIYQVLIVALLLAVQKHHSFAIDTKIIPQSIQDIISKLRPIKVGLLRRDEIDKLKKAEGISLLLMDIVQTSYKKVTDDPEYSDVAETVLMVLHARGDLTENDLKWIRDTLEDQLKIPTTRQNNYLIPYKEDGLIILSKYPSQANEDILIKYLQPEGDASYHSFGMWASESLADIGTAKAIPALEAFKKTCSPESSGYEQATNAILKIQEREQQKSKSESTKK